MGPLWDPVTYAMGPTPEVVSAHPRGQHDPAHSGAGDALKITLESRPGRSDGEMEAV